MENERKLKAGFEKEDVKNWVSYGPVVSEIPVVLAEFYVDIPVVTDINLPTAAVEIKRITKDVCLTQCQLIGTSTILSISGFVRKNIEYVDDDSCLQDFTVDVDFDYTMDIAKYLKHYIWYSSKYQNEFLFGENCCCKDKFCKDFKRKDLTDWAHLNEPVFCKLLRYYITETDINRQQDEEPFTTLHEKMVVSLALKVLQKRQIYIPRPYYGEGKEEVQGEER
ncbi:hypothetical protein OW763_01980 [Clostridium aestuarii]|uniref:DUF7852 domain-containing protein n=1 Tax=Clostridium aestuarii TaxID=338193 RepID=A0ABT4CVW7_9CLOT|nr:hypothetical protein [Clostridium aestuarii]MCY6483123.1 hypothetical protein [Clostridium aestuarii]